MGNKAQAKQNSEFAKRMKDQGIFRKTFQCPINHRHTHPVGYGFFTPCR